MVDKDPNKEKPEKILKDLKIITAISLGKDRNKELAKVLDTDKSFTSKKVRELQQKGLVSKVGEGKKTRYRINPFHVMQFLQSKVVITTKKKVEVRDNEEEKEKDRSKV